VPNFTLLNTRPAAQAQTLTHLVQAAGGQALACPTIEIDFLPIEGSARSQMQELLGACDKAIFVSVNAVQGLLRQQAYWPARLPALYAIGRATLQAGREHGLAMQTVEGERYDSEALLERADLYALSGQRVLLIKGEGGRDKLEQTLRERGAQVDSLVLYRRAAKPLSRTAWSQFSQSRQPIVLASSLTGLAYLMSALEQAQSSQSVRVNTDQAWSEWVKKQPLVVFSQRIADWATKQGWQGPIAVVATHSDRGIMACIEDLLQPN